MAEFETPPAFTQEHAEPSEIEKLTARIENYTIPMKPNTVNAIKAIMELGLSKGMFKADDLDAIITIREETNKGIIEYQTQVKRAQEQFAILQAKEVETRQIAVQEQRARETQLVIDERILRKRTQDRLAQIEAVLAAQGLSIDLDGNGVIGLPTGQVADTLTAREQQQVADMLAQSRLDELLKADVVPVVTTPVDLAPVPKWSAEATPDVPPAQTGKPGPAFALARMMNPVTPAEPIPEVTKTFSEFVEEVEKVSQEETEEEFDEITIYPNLPVAEVEVSEVEFLDLPKVSEEPSTITPKSFITGGNAPNLKAPVLTAVPSADDVVLKKSDIRIIENYEETQEETEEEFDEITVPNRADLSKMTKSEIETASITLGFDISTKDTKAKMIDSFEEQANILIAELTGSAEFVSATDDVTVGDGDGDSNSRDGGYF